MVAISNIKGHLALNGTTRTNELLLDILAFLRIRQVLFDRDMKLAEGKCPVHIVDLPVALEWIDETFGVLAYELMICGPLRIIVVPDLEPEKVGILHVVLNLCNLAVLKVVLACIVRFLQRVVNEKDFGFAEDKEFAVTFCFHHRHVVGCLTYQLVEGLDHWLWYLNRHNLI